jgi:uncharacterized protein YdaU (DUF1376 family)
VFHYPFHINDYRAATLHLSNDEDLAYRRLLDFYYDTEKPIPNDVEWLAKRLRCKKAVIESVLKDMFNLEDNFWHNARCDAEINKYQSFSLNGAKGAAIRWKKAKDSDAIATPKGGNRGAIGGLESANSNQNQNQNQEPIIKPLSNKFDEFWSVWPSSSRKVGKMACLKKWEARKLDSIGDKIIAHVKSLRNSKSWLSGFDPAPLTYINQSRWEDSQDQVSDPNVLFGRRLISGGE